MRLAQMSSRSSDSYLNPQMVMLVAMLIIRFFFHSFERDNVHGAGDAVVQWLPQRPPLQPSEWFRNGGERVKTIDR